MMDTFKVLLLDPSLFTAPYDAALTQGLKNAGLDVDWAARPPRDGEFDYLPSRRAITFYRQTDRLRGIPQPLGKILKGLAHVVGMSRVVAYCLRRRPRIVHFQWLCVPIVDVLAIIVLRRLCSVVITCHDTTPYNGDRLSFFQRFAFDLPLRLAAKVVVHTRGARDKLVSRGTPTEKIAVIPHGPLQLPVSRSSLSTLDVSPVERNARYTFVLFGELKPYKGIDLLIEAIASLSLEDRCKSRFIVAGRPQMDLQPLQRRAAELDLGASFDLRPGRLSEPDMHALFSEADAFVFPYRQIDASGVFFLVSGLHKWIIASRVGVFAEAIVPGRSGTLVAPEDVAALRDALRDAIADRPIVDDAMKMTDWDAIGAMTRNLYEAAPLAPQLLKRRFAS